MGATAAGESKVTQAFASLRARGGIGLMPFLPAGYPDLKATQASILAAQRGGATVIELGIPFSDPVADGPVIQQAFAEALAGGVRLAGIFAAIAEIRSQLTIPLVAMVSYSIVFRYGVERFAADARQAGFSGLIIPDLPPPEAQAVCQRVWDAGLDTCLLVAPTTSPARRAEIANLCTGFIYYLSVSGITGERNSLPPDIDSNLKQIKELTDKPVCVGFGISTPQHVQQLLGKADGAIVGSALVRRIAQAIGSTDAIANAVETYCRELLSQAG